MWCNSEETAVAKPVMSGGRSPHVLTPTAQILPLVPHHPNISKHFLCSDPPAEAAEDVRVMIPVGYIPDTLLLNGTPDLDAGSSVQPGSQTLPSLPTRPLPVAVLIWECPKIGVANIVP